MMAKKANGDDMQDIEEIRFRLSQQDKTLSEILMVLRGSIATDTDGLMKKVREIKDSMDQLISDVAHLQRWKKMVQDNKGKVTITVGVFLQRIFMVIGGAGTLVGIILALKELFDK